MTETNSNHEAVRAIVYFSVAFFASAMGTLFARRAMKAAQV